MTDTATPSRVRLRSPGDVLAAVPFLVGHHPHESVVLLCLRPPRDQVRLTMRVDLPDPGHWPELASMLVGHARRAGADAVVLAVYTEQADLPVDGIVAACRVELAGAGCELRDALLVRESRWRSLLCTDPSCCPPEGRALPAPPPQFAAEMALEGRAPLADREALERSVAPVGFLRAAAMAQAFAAEEEALHARLLAGTSLAQLRTESEAAFVAALDSTAEGRPVDDRAAARLVLGWTDLSARDAVLARAAEPDTSAVRALLVDLARRAQAPYDAAPAAMLAWIAYASGDGALANVAVERALRSDPTYSLAQLVDHALQHGLEPRLLREVSRATARGDRPGRRRSSGRRPR